MLGIKYQQNNKIHIVDILDKVRNECIKEKVEVASTLEKVVESCLMRYGHVWKSPTRTRSTKKTRSDGG